MAKKLYGIRAENVAWAKRNIQLGKGWVKEGEKGLKKGLRGSKSLIKRGTSLMKHSQRAIGKVYGKGKGTGKGKGWHGDPAGHSAARKRKGGRWKVNKYTGRKIYVSPKGYSSGFNWRG